MQIIHALFNYYVDQSSHLCVYVCVYCGWLSNINAVYRNKF